jgi:hypothetical protein
LAPLFVGKKLEQAAEPPQRAIGMADAEWEAKSRKLSSPISALGTGTTMH